MSGGDAENAALMAIPLLLSWTFFEVKEVTSLQFLQTNKRKHASIAKNNKAFNSRVVDRFGNLTSFDLVVGTNS